MAVQFPQASFVGVDIDEAAIASAQATAQEAGLTNIALLMQSLEDLPKALGEFDYILAHGVYSWVPSHVREQLWLVAKERLAPGGLFYMSYNVSAGWEHLKPYRQSLLDRVKHVASAEEQIEIAIKETQSTLAKLPSEAVQLQKALRLALLMAEEQPGYFLSEYLATENTSMSVDEVLKSANTNALRYLGDADAATDSLSNINSSSRSTINELQASAGISRLEARDRIVKCRYRSALFVKATDVAPFSEMESLQLGLSTLLEKTEVKVGHFRFEPAEDRMWRFQTKDALTVRIIDYLGPYFPHSISLEQLCEALNVELTQVLPRVRALHEGGHLGLRSLPVRPIDKDARRVSWLRREAATRECVTDLWHRPGAVSDELRQLLSQDEKTPPIPKRLRAEALLLGL